MGVERVKHGETFQLVGTLGTGGTLIGLTGSPGALIEVEGTARNRGVIELYGARAPHKQGATLAVGGVLINGGSIDVGGGVGSTHAALLEVDGTLTNKGVLSAQAGNDGFGAQVVVQGGARLGNFGTIALGAGAYARSLGATLSVAGVLVNDVSGVIDAGGGRFGAEIAVSGTLINDGMVLLRAALVKYHPSSSATLSVAGVLQNNGTIVVGMGEGDIFYNPTYADAAASLAVSGTLTNVGSIFVTGGASGFQSITRAHVSSTITVTGTLINQGSVTVGAGDPGGHYTYPGQPAALNDLGVIENTGLLVLQGESPPLYYYSGNNAPFPELGGRLLDSGVLNNDGTLLMQENTHLTVLGTLDNTGELQVNGGTSFRYISLYHGAGGAIQVDGKLLNSGTLDLGGGVTGLLSIGGLSFAGGEGAELNVASFGVLNNSGLVNIGGGGGGYPHYGNSSPPLYNGTGATLTLARSGGFNLFNTGTIDIGRGMNSPYGVSGTGGLLRDGGNLNNAAGALITVEGNFGDASGTLDVLRGATLRTDGTINGAGVLRNEGSVSFDNGAARIVVGTFINDGTISGASRGMGRDTIDTAIGAEAGQTGTITLLGEHLRLGAAVAADQTIVFEPSSYSFDYSTLELGDLAEFAATLDGISNGSTIDFLNQTVVSATTAGDTLTIGVAGGASYAIGLTAPLSGLSLTLRSDGHGGTDLAFAGVLGGK